MILGFRYSSVQKAVTVQYVVVAGGGGGGISSGGSPGGGGGGGGYRSSVIGEGSGREPYDNNLLAEQTLAILTGVSVPVSVGAGGPNTTVGVDSVLSSITSTGGGRGGGAGGQAGGNGGSGGGAGSNTFAAGGTGATGQGWDGNAAGNAYGGGGGGAGSSSPGGVASYTKGGRGRRTLITGSAQALAGGGCGGAPDTLGGAGGGSNNVYDTVNPPGGFTPTSGTSIFYGGGNSGYNAAGPATGTANTGGGGGGGSSARNENGAAGGSGIILLKYPDTHTVTIGAGLTGSNNAALGGFKTTVITAGAGNISWQPNPSGIIPNDGSTQDNPAPSAVYLRDTLGITTSGNYWIKPMGYSGAAVLLYCDMTNLGGGWVLIGKGRASSDNNSGWFGTNDELSLSGLQQANALAGGISKVSSTFVNYLMNGTASGWTNGNANNYMVANRVSNATDGYSGIGDSFYHKITNQSQFAWVNQFGSTPTDSAVQTGTGVNRRYAGTWLSGGQSGADVSGFSDNDFSSGNGTGRLFTWHWSGHGSLHGWSSGSSESRGQQSGSEGHALQFVQLWAR